MEEKKELVGKDLIEKIKEEKKTKEKIKISKAMKIITIFIILLFLVFLGFKYSKSLNHKETIIDFGFKDVGELVTQEWYGRILEDSTKDRKIFKKISVPFTESRIIFSLDVEVTAGLNFKEIEQDISEDGKTVTITIPKAKIYKYYQVPNTFNSYLDDESWFTNINSKERHDLEDAVVEKGKEKALEAGLLEKADKNAKTIIEQMVKAKDKDIDIIWKEK